MVRAKRRFDQLRCAGFLERELSQNPTFEELHRALINRSQTTVKVSAYRSLSHSVLACARMEEFGSASFQSERKFRYAAFAFAFAVSPVSA